MSKKVQTKYGEVTIETPRDRDGTFQPETVKKRETILANGMADQIIEMYAMGTSTSNSLTDSQIASRLYSCKQRLKATTKYLFTYCHLSSLSLTSVVNQKSSFEFLILGRD